MNKPKNNSFNLEQYEKTIKKFNNSTYLGPFKATGYYVDDRRGDTIIECNNTDMAKILADILNNLPPPEMLQKPLEKVDSSKVEVKVQPVERIALSPVTETTEAKIKKLL